jgi:hypothetical protein
MLSTENEREGVLQNVYDAIIHVIHCHPLMSSVCAVDDSRPRHHTRRKRTVLGQKVCAFAVLHTHNVWRKHPLKCTCFESRILQLWIRLPAAQRSVEPRVQLIRLKDAPIRHEPGVEARIYSGSSGGLLSPTKNYAPVTMVDFQLGPGAEVTIHS